MGGIDSLREFVKKGHALGPQVALDVLDAYDDVKAERDRLRALESAVLDYRDALADDDGDPAAALQALWRALYGKAERGGR